MPWPPGSFGLEKLHPRPCRLGRRAESIGFKTDGSSGPRLTGGMRLFSLFVEVPSLAQATDWLRRCSLHSLVGANGSAKACRTACRTLVPLVQFSERGRAHLQSHVWHARCCFGASQLPSTGLGRLVFTWCARSKWTSEASSWHRLCPFCQHHFGNPRRAGLLDASS